MNLTHAFLAGLVSGVGFILGQSLIVVLVARWNARLAAKAARKAAEARAATDRALAVAAQKREELNRAARSQPLSRWPVFMVRRDSNAN